MKRSNTTYSASLSCAEDLESFRQQLYYNHSKRTGSVYDPQNRSSIDQVNAYEWQKAKMCHIWNRKFSKMTNPRHHCRFCCKSVCKSHSVGRWILKGESHRVCDQCQDERAVNEAREKQEQEKARLNRQLMRLQNSGTSNQSEQYSNQRKLLDLKKKLMDIQASEDRKLHPIKLDIQLQETDNQNVKDQIEELNTQVQLFVASKSAILDQISDRTIKIDSLNKDKAAMKNLINDLQGQIEFCKQKNRKHLNHSEIAGKLCKSCLSQFVPQEDMPFRESMHSIREEGHQDSDGHHSSAHRLYSIESRGKEESEMRNSCIFNCGGKRK